MNGFKVSKIILVVVILFMGLLVFSKVALAQDSLKDQVMGQVDAAKTTAGYTSATDPRATIGAVIKIFLGFVGSIFIILIAMASYWFIIARGREDKIEKATKTMRGAVIGLFIVVLSYAITSFVASGAQRAVKAPEGSSRFDCLNTEEGCW